MRPAGLLLLAAALAAPAAPADTGTEVAVRGLQAWLDGTRDLECRFEQELVSGALGGGIREWGVLYLLKPGRMRWEYLDPEPKTALVERDRTLLYLPSDRQLLRGELPSDEGLLPNLLAGDGRVTELFETSAAGPAGPGAEDGFRLRMRPKARAESFEEVILTLRPSDWAIVAAEVHDAAGNRTVYRFRDLRRNRGMSPAVFRFEPPPGTEIVDVE
jgi:outer membrane lipoprotein carrier protein